MSSAASRPVSGSAQAPTPHRRMAGARSEAEARRRRRALAGSAVAIVADAARPRGPRLSSEVPIGAPPGASGVCGARDRGAGKRPRRSSRQCLGARARGRALDVPSQQGQRSAAQRPSSSTEPPKHGRGHEGPARPEGVDPTMPFSCGRLRPSAATSGWVPGVIRAVVASTPIRQAPSGSAWAMTPRARGLRAWRSGGRRWTATQRQRARGA